MKFSKLSQLILVSSVGLLVATLLSACQIVTIDFVYVASSAGLTASSNDGQIDAYAVDSESGALRPGATAVSSGGAGPVSMAVTADYKNLYVANQTDNTIVHFTIGINGALTQKDAVTLGSQGVTPVYLTANSVGTYLYLVSQSQPNCHSTCSGTLAVFNLGSGGVIGSAVANGSLNYWPLTLPGFTGDSI